MFKARDFQLVYFVYSLGGFSAQFGPGDGAGRVGVGRSAVSARLCENNPRVISEKW